MSAHDVPRPIADLVSRLDLSPAHVAPYGHHLAKIDHRLGSGPPPKGVRTVLVTAINPTPAGEGKTVHTIGVAMALCALGKRAIATLRQPSMGPIFGVKGGGSGGGASQLLPRDRVNLHLTGDFHAVAAANNLLAAALDTSILLDNPLHIDPERVTWRRVLDVNDRALREVRTGLGGTANGIPRDAGFDITAASEVMAVLALAEDLTDLRRRLGRMVVAESFEGRAVTAEDLGVAGSMAAVLRDALDPTLVQTSEGTPALVHTGPFANIAHGNASIVADRLAMQLGDYVVTEAGFGADMGAEKYLNIKCRASGLRPDAAVLVVTLRALKLHSGRFPVAAGKPLPEELFQPAPEALEDGLELVAHHLEVLSGAGVPVVVAINRFPTDTEEELERVRRRCVEAGALAAVPSEVFARGSAGGLDLGRAVIEAAESGRAKAEPTYSLELPLAEKVRTIARRHYGARDVIFEPRALEQLQRLEDQGLGRLPVCMAKTQYSLTADGKRLGRPRDFDLPVRELRAQVGAGFVVALCGTIQTMPGLGRNPAYKSIDLTPEGEITGLA